MVLTSSRSSFSPVVYMWIFHIGISIIFVLFIVNTFWKTNHHDYPQPKEEKECYDRSVKDHHHEANVIDPVLGRFSSTPPFPKECLSNGNVGTTCPFPQSEIQLVEKSQQSSVPQCRISSLRMTFEKDACHQGWKLPDTLTGLEEESISTSTTCIQ